MTNEEIIKRLWDSDLCDEKIVEYLYDMCVNTNDHKMAIKVSDVCRRNIGKFKSDPNKSYRFYELYEMCLRYAAERDFKSFLIYNELDRPKEQRFYQPRAKQLEPIVSALQRISDGELDELFISQPPRTGKSTLVQLFLVWFSKTRPEKANLYCSYAQGVAETFYDGCIEFLTDPTYRLCKMFPSNELVYQNKQNGSIDLRRHKKYKSINCKSLYGQLNGSMDASGILIGDDLLSGIEEAMNPDILSKCLQRVNNNLLSRAKEGCAKIFIATRWHPNDPIGARIKMIEDGREFKNLRYEVVNIPALDDHDESNFEYDYGVGFSTEYYRKLRAQFEAADDLASWYAQYQGTPYFREGLLFPDERLRKYFELPEFEPDAVLAICDTKATGTDYAFLPVAYKYGQDYYIDDCICDNGNPEIVDVRCATTLRDRNVQMCRFESNSAGGRVADRVNELIHDMGGRCHITKKYTTANKETKIIQNSGFIKEHFLFRDKSTISPGTDYWKMMQFLTTYVSDGKNKHDDVPDGLAMLSEFIASIAGVQVEVVRPFF